MSKVCLQQSYSQDKQKVYLGTNKGGAAGKQLLSNQSEIKPTKNK